MRIEGKTAIVTGASSGLGQAAARLIARRGARVALVARRGDRLEELAREIEGRGGRALAVPCDVADPEAVTAAFERIRRELGEPDILVNAAGMGVWKHFDDIPVSVHRAMMDVNYWGAFHWIRAVLPGMRARRRGRVVNVSSGVGKFALAVTNGYSASKFALTGLSESLHRELAGSGVGVSCLHPGSIRTAFWSEENKPARLIPPLVRFAPKLSAQAAARAVAYCIWFALPVWTTPVFVALLAKLNALWIRLGDLLLWRWFVPVAAGVFILRFARRWLGG
jgi:NAD(P)-dependent dehydrogenase (short-subunit alcohol dehydrogenase family)